MIQNLLDTSSEHDSIKDFMQNELNQKFCLKIMNSLLKERSDLKFVSTEKFISQYISNKALFSNVSKVLRTFCSKERALANSIHEIIKKNIKTNHFYLLYASLIDILNVENVDKECKDFIKLLPTNEVTIDFINNNAEIITKIARSYCAEKNLNIICQFMQNVLALFNQSIGMVNSNKMISGFQANKTKLLFIELLIIGIVNKCLYKGLLISFYPQFFKNSH